MRRSLLGLVLLLLLVWSIPALAEPPQQDGGVLTGINTRINLRSGPGTEWRILGTVEAGTPIRLDGHDPSGLWVRGIVPGGEVGWVARRYVDAPDEQVFALPSIWVDVPFTLPAPEGGVVPPSAPQNPEQPQQPAPPEGGAGTSVARRVNFRTAPSTASTVLATLDAGTPFSADGRDPSNRWVHGAIPGGQAGWIFATFLTISPGEIAGLPVIETSVASAAAAPVTNTAPVRGFNFGGHVEGFSDYAAGLMHYAGMTWVKRQWRYFAGQNPGDVAGIINDAHAKGFRILIGIVGLPGEVNNGGYFEQYAAFVGGVAGLGADAIEVWNEMNIDREWPAGSIDPGRYTELLRQSYNAIKASNPNTLVISGAPAPTGYFGGCGPNGCDDNAYIAGMAVAGATRYADCMGLHYNEGILGPSQTSGDPRGNSGHYTRYFYGMLNTYSRAFGGKSLCFTELGYLTPEGFPPLPGGFAWAQSVTLAQQAGWLDQVVSLAARSGKVRLLIIWNVDFTQYGDDPMAGYAMIRPDGSCPACDALAR